MDVAVYHYQWTYGDFYQDTEITKISELKVTKEFFLRHQQAVPRVKRRLIEESRELVDERYIVEGRYHPELVPTSYRARILAMEAGEVGTWSMQNLHIHDAAQMDHIVREVMKAETEGLIRINGRPHQPSDGSGFYDAVIFEKIRDGGRSMNIFERVYSELPPGENRLITIDQIAEDFPAVRTSSVDRNTPRTDFEACEVAGLRRLDVRSDGWVVVRPAK